MYAEQLDPLDALALRRMERLLGNPETNYADQVFEVSPTLIAWSEVTDRGGADRTRQLRVVRTEPASGLVRESQSFAENELAALWARVGEIRARPSAAPTPNTAVVIGGFVNSAIREDTPLDGLVADPARLVGEERPPFGLSERRVLAVDGDHLALLEVQLADGAWAFSVEEVDEQGQVAAWTVFDGDQLVEAVDHLARRGAEIRGPNAVIDPTQIYAMTMRAQDTDAHASAITDDYLAVDHRALGWAEVSRDQTIELIGAATTQAILVPSGVLAVGDDRLLALTSLYDGEAGSLLEGQVSLAVVAVRDGKVSRVDLFAEDDLAGAQAWFDRSKEGEGDGLSNSADGHWNDAHRVMAATERIVEPIAARAEHLMLVALEWDLVLIELDTSGSVRERVTFPLEDLAPAMAELNRRHQATLAPVEALWYDENEDLQAAIGAKDLDGLMEKIDPGVQMIDHRSMGWPTGGYEVWLDRARSLYESVQTVSAVNERYYCASPDGVGVFATRYRTTMAHGAAPTAGHVIVSQSSPASGYATLIEQFDEADIEAALARGDELEASLSGLDTCRAVAVGGAVNMLARSRRDLSLDGIVSPEAEFVRPSGEGVPVSTQDDLRSLGFGGPDRSVVAVRSDQLALIDMGLPDGGRIYSLEEIDDQDRMVAVRQFSADDLVAAMDALDDRWFGRNSDLAPKNGPTILAAGKALRSPRPADVLADLLHPSFTGTDHRPGHFDTWSRTEWLAGADAGRAQGGTFVAREIHTLDDRGFVFSMVQLTGHAGVDAIESDAATICVVLEDGLLRGTETFALGDVDAALARFDELTSRALHDGAPSAVEQAMANAIEALNRGDIDAVGALLDPALDFVSHVELVDADQSTPQPLDSLASLIEDDPTFTATPIALATDDLAVFRIRMTAASRLVGETVSMIEVGQGGHATLAHFWPIDGLQDALAACTRRHMTAETDMSETRRRLRQTILACTDRDRGGVLSHLDEDFVCRQHRPNALFEDVDRHGWADLQLSLVEEFPQVATWVSTIAESADATLERVRRWADPTSEEPELDILVVATFRDGRAVSADIFEVEQLAEAQALFDERVAAASDTPGEARNRASDELARIVKAGASGVSAIHAPLPDHLAAVLGGPTTTVRVLGLWREHLALVEVAGPSVDQRLIVLVECDDRGTIIHIQAWDRADADLAAAEMTTRGRVVNDLSPALEAWAQLGMNTNQHHAQGFANMFAADAVIIDHSPVGFGTITQAELLGGTLALFEMLPRLAASGWLLRETEHVLLSQSLRFGTSADGVEVELAQLSLVCTSPEGLIERFEAFPLDQLSEALTRFDELAAETPSDAADGVRSNAVSRLADQMDGTPETLAPLLDVDVVLDDRRSVVSVGRTAGRDAVVAAAAAWADVGLRPDRGATGRVAVRGEDHGLGRIVHVDDAGNQIEWLALFSLGPSGLIRRIVVFDGDDDDAAFDELNAAYTGSLPPHLQILRERQVRGMHAVMTGDTETLDEIYADGHGGQRPSFAGDGRGDPP